ncbi:MAG: hypothetical protein WDN45_08990 [Caulobacteraceae bacterium]
MFQSGLPETPAAHSAAAVAQAWGPPRSAAAKISRTPETGSIGAPRPDSSWWPSSVRDGAWPPCAACASNCAPSA